MGRPPVEKKQRQLPVALSDDMRAKLEAASERAGHSIAEEIRRRLEWTLDLELADERTDLELVDERTRDLLKAIARLAHEIGLETNVYWHSHDGGYAAFRQGVEWMLDEFRAAALRDWARASGLTAPDRKLGAPSGNQDAAFKFSTPPNLTFGPRPNRANPSDNPRQIGLAAAVEVLDDLKASREAREERRLRRQRACEKMLEGPQRTEQEGDEQ